MTERSPEHDDEGRVPSRGTARQAAANRSSRIRGSNAESQGSRQRIGALLAGLSERLRRTGVVGVLVLLLGVAGGVLLIAADASTVIEVETEQRSCEDVANLELRDKCVESGGERHGSALALLGPLAIFLAFAAGLYGTRLAALGLCVVGAIALAIGLIGDLPDIGKEGPLAVLYDDPGKVKAGVGLWLEVAAGGVCLVAGLLGLRRRY